MSRRDLTMYDKVINQIVSYLTTFIDAVIKVTSFVPNSALLVGGGALLIYLFVDRIMK